MASAAVARQVLAACRALRRQPPLRACSCGRLIDLLGATSTARAQHGQAPPVLERRRPLVPACHRAQGGRRARPCGSAWPCAAGAAAERGGAARDRAAARARSAAAARAAGGCARSAAARRGADGAGHRDGRAARRPGRRRRRQERRGRHRGCCGRLGAPDKQACKKHCALHTVCRGSCSLSWVAVSMRVPWGLSAFVHGPTHLIQACSLTCGSMCTTRNEAGSDTHDGLLPKCALRYCICVDLRSCLAARTSQHFAVTPSRRFNCKTHTSDVCYCALTNPGCGHSLYTYSCPPSNYLLTSHSPSCRSGHAAQSKALPANEQVHSYQPSQLHT
jgi:hypothetical protein